MSGFDPLNIYLFIRFSLLSQSPRQIPQERPCTTLEGVAGDDRLPLRRPWPGRILPRFPSADHFRLPRPSLCCPPVRHALPPIVCSAQLIFPARESPPAPTRRYSPVGSRRRCLPVRHILGLKRSRRTFGPDSLNPAEADPPSIGRPMGPATADPCGRSPESPNLDPERTLV